MSALATLTVRSALITLLSAIASPNNFEEVRAVPLAVALRADIEKAIFEKFPSLKTPACLVALLDAEDAGKRLERRSTWLLILVGKDANGAPEEITLPRADAVRALRSTTVATRCHLEEDMELTVVETSPQYSVVGLKVTTREYGT